MLNKTVMSLVVSTILLSANTAFAQTITFDDLSLSSAKYNYAVIANGYQGLNWGNFDAINTQGWMPVGDTYGAYANGVVSPNNIAFNAGGLTATISSSTPFTLNDAYFTAAFLNGLQIQALATIAGGGTYMTTFTVNTTGPVDQVFNFSNIRSVTFTASGGTPAAWTSKTGRQFAMDNLTINAPVPEPDTYGMLLAGLGLMGFIVHRRTRDRV